MVPLFGSGLKTLIAFSRGFLLAPRRPLQSESNSI